MSFVGALWVAVSAVLVVGLVLIDRLPRVDERSLEVPADADLRQAA